MIYPIREHHRQGSNISWKMTVKKTEKRIQAIPQDRRKNPERENKIKIKRNKVVPHRVLLQLSYISDSQN